MVDFSSLVLAPAMDVFGRPVTIDPRRSMRTSPVPYAATGIFSQRHIDIMGMDGGVTSDTVTTLGIRLADFVVAPVAQDRVTIDNLDYFIDDVNVDGQGGATLTLRKVIE